MTDFLLYMGFSLLETSAIFYMMFKVFKIDLYPIEILFSSLIMAFISYEIRNVYHLPEVDVFIQILMMFSFVWMLFRIHIFYAPIITGMTYLTYGLIQTIYYLLMDKLGLFSATLPYIFSISTYILQTISALTAFAIGWFIGKKRNGFDFVPDKPNGKISVNTQDKILFVLNIPSFFILEATVYMVEHWNKSFIITPFIYAFILLGYVYFAYKKDRGEYGHFSQ